MKRDRKPKVVVPEIVDGGTYSDLVVQFATDGITNKIFVSRHQLYLPEKEQLRRELARAIEGDTRRANPPCKRSRARRKKARRRNEDSHYDLPIVARKDDVMMTEDGKEFCNFVKMREDQDLVGLSACADGVFKELSDSSWTKVGDDLQIGNLRKRVEPWLTALFQSEHLSLLVGTGLTSAACCAANGKPRAMGDVKFENYGEKIDKAATESAKRFERGEKNFEDTIRVANELLRGLRVQGIGKAADKLEKEISDKLSGLVKDLLANENTLKKDAKGNSWRLLGNFLMSFAARSGGKDRLNLFTTNYDRVLVETSDIIGLRLVDRFVGSLAPVFRSSRLDVDYHYNPPGIRGEPRYLEGVVRYTKLHGSLDWFKCGNLIRRLGVPFGAADVTSYLTETGSIDKREFIIYPNSAKDRDTAEYPYVDLFRDLAAAICRPNSTLVTYGYGFGDGHINRIIEDALTIASTHLVILSYDDANGRISTFYKRIRSKSQVSLLVGHDVASLEALTAHYLPKPAIDTATDRMVKVLEDRRVFEDRDDEKKLKEPV